MKLIFLHGPPASGKYTIARELEAKSGFGIFHNHLTIDVARPLFEFGTPEFWSFVEELRLTCLRAAAKNSRRTIVYTSCYDHPNDLPLVEELKSIVNSADGTFVPIYLQCDLAELEKRVGNQSRIKMGKIRSIEGLHKNLKNWNCSPIPGEACKTIVTAGKSPSECAEEIIDLLQLK